MDLKAVYAEIGSEARVYDLMLEFYQLMASDVMIGFFFTGRDLDAISRKQAEFILRAMGARGSYSGKSPAQAHTHLPPILPGFFDRRAVLLEQVLRSRNLSEAAIQAWLNFEEQFRRAIVQR
ncbi:MAG: hypothetical protein KGQ59_03705 [Bdellovibrionales bacterium]|nr:hypothetical protein [Bdellovibrionales bacterium]